MLLSRSVLPSCLIAMTCMVGLSSSQILPDEVCLTTQTMFVLQECVTDEEPFMCKILAFVHLFDIDGVRLCTSFPCEGYNQPEVRTCVSLGNCSFADVELSGICNPFQFCCVEDTVFENSSGEVAVKALDDLLTAIKNSVEPHFIKNSIKNSSGELALKALEDLLTAIKTTVELHFIKNSIKSSSGELAVKSLADLLTTIKNSIEPRFTKTSVKPHF